MARYISLTSILNPVNFIIKNVSSVMAGYVRLEINTKRETYRIFDEYDYPEIPQKKLRYIPSFYPRKKDLQVDNSKENWRLIAKFGNIQPGATYVSDKFFIGSRHPCEINIEPVIYADNIPKPIVVSLTIKIETKNRELESSEIE